VARAPTTAAPVPEPAPTAATAAPTASTLRIEVAGTTTTAATDVPTDLVALGATRDPDEGLSPIVLAGAAAVLASASVVGLLLWDGRRRRTPPTA